MSSQCDQIGPFSISEVTFLYGIVGGTDIGVIPRKARNLSRDFRILKRGTMPGEHFVDRVLAISKIEIFQVSI